MSNEQAILGRMAAVNDSLAGLQRASSAVSGIVAGAAGLGAGARGVAVSARGLVGGSATGVDVRMAASLGATEANARALSAALERALADLATTKRHLEAELSDLRRELEAVRREERERQMREAMRRY